MLELKVRARRALLLRCAEVLLVLGMVLSAAAGASLIGGVNGLGLGEHLPGWAFPGASGTAMRVEAVFDDDAGVTIAHPPRTLATSDGVRDAATGGAALEVHGPFSGQVSYLNPSLPERWVWVAWQASLPLLVATSLLVLFRLVRSVRHGSPFTTANADRLRGLALLVGVGGSTVSLAGALVPSWLLGTSGAAAIVETRGYISFAPLVAGLLIGILAQVWRAGVELARDLDGTV